MTDLMLGADIIIRATVGITIAALVGLAAYKLLDDIIIGLIVTAFIGRAMQIVGL